MPDRTPDAPGLSPAARALLTELNGPAEGIPAHGPSILELRSRRLEPVLEELIAADLAVVTDRGHLTSVAALGRLARWVCEHCVTQSCELGVIADAWDVSRGRARALLSALVRDEMVVKDQDGYRCADH